VLSHTTSWQVALYFYHTIQVSVAKKKLSKVSGLEAKGL
jgi:hypothetical protein